MYSAGASKPSLLLLNFQGLSFLIKMASSSPCPGGCLSVRLSSRAERPSFSPLKAAPEKLACADFTVIKARQAGWPAQGQQDEQSALSSWF